jgi:phage head maturation protease
MADFQIFMPIAKIDKENQTVSGYASTPARDSDGEIITLEAVRKALPDYMRWSNIREMHGLSAVGVAQEANMDSQGLFLTAKIVDTEAWKKCQEGVYKGFSIGGRKLGKSGNKITAIEMTEISVVDRPANSECSFTLAKSAKSSAGMPGYLLKIKAQRTPEQKALKKMAEIVGDLTKGGPPAAHDGFSLPAPGAESSPKDTSVQNNKAEGTVSPCEAHGKIGCKKCAIVKRMSEKCKEHDKIGCAACGLAKGGDEPGNGSKPYGDVEYADPGHRADKKARYPVDTEEHIRAAWSYVHKKKNEAKYSPADLASVKAKIVSAWKSKIDKSGPPEITGAATAEPTVKAAVSAETFGFLTLGKKTKTPVAVSGEVLPAFLELRKGMSVAGSLSYVFDSLRGAQRSLMIEGKREGGDKKDQGLATRLGQIASDLSGIISQKAEHEGKEALDFSDADDQFLQTLLGDSNMAGGNFGQAAQGDPLAAAMLNLMKRAAEPTKAQRLAEASENVQEARKAAKAACKVLKAAHDMHKAAFLAKAAKVKGKDGKDDKDGDEFDHAGAMEKLQKAYNEMDKARTFGKAAIGNIAKAAGRSGQRGQEAGDGEAGVYEVPAGVRDLSPRDLSTAGPGGGQRGSEPPIYPVDGGVYADKAAGTSDLRKYANQHGQIDANIAALIMEKAVAQGELDVLRRMPQSVAGGRRPMAFDTSKVFGGGGGGMGTPDAGALNKALFDGVDVGALNSGDERAHTEASAKVIGNFLTSGAFGKSILDPAFAGAAGAGRRE